MSTVGKLSRKFTTGIRGFTLLELLVVVALLSVVAAVAVPRIAVNLPADPQKVVSRWLMINIGHLKQKAVYEQQDFFLHLDMTAQQMWITSTAAAPDLSDPLKENRFVLPRDVRLVDVEFPLQQHVERHRAAIHFNKAGYSDHALIHLATRDGHTWTFLIEAFLHQVRQRKGRITFADDFYSKGHHTPFSTRS